MSLIGDDITVTALNRPIIEPQWKLVRHWCYRCNRGSTEAAQVRYVAPPKFCQHGEESVQMARTQRLLVQVGDWYV